MRHLRKLGSWPVLSEKLVRPDGLDEKNGGANVAGIQESHNARERRRSRRQRDPSSRHGGPGAGVIGTRLYESHPPRYEYFPDRQVQGARTVLKALYKG
jgi:hypothetical protein